MLRKYEDKEEARILREAKERQATFKTCEKHAIPTLESLGYCLKYVGSPKQLFKNAS